MASPGLHFRSYSVRSPLTSEAHLAPAPFSRYSRLRASLGLRGISEGSTISAWRSWRGQSPGPLRERLRRAYRCRGGAVLLGSRAQTNTRLRHRIKCQRHDKGKPVERRGRKA
jgi:hypothetical protein